jgi:hypothetical protein
MRKPVVTAILALLAGTVLGGTVFQAPIGYAATSANSVLNVFVTNDSTHPVPMREQNIDANANIKVHEQGTANVNVTNSSLSVTAAAVTRGGGGVGPAPARSTAEGIAACSPTPCTATVLVINMTTGVGAFALSLGTPPPYAAVFEGPASGGPGSIQLSLPRPITFDTFLCIGTSSDSCTFSWVGAQP